MAVRAFTMSAVHNYESVKDPAKGTPDATDLLALISATGIAIFLALTLLSHLLLRRWHESALEGRE